MEVWKMVFRSSLKIFHFIPFWHLPYSISKFPFHTKPWLSILYYYWLLLHFNPNGCSQFENPEALNFEEIASAYSSFSTLLLPSSLPLPTSFIKVLPLPQKINRFRFQLPLPHPCLQRYTSYRNSKTRNNKNN